MAPNAQRVRPPFDKLKVGDIVQRIMGAVIPMTLKITAIDDEFIHCGSWKFSKVTGAEIDEELGWGDDRTGSQILPWAVDLSGLNSEVKLHELQVAVANYLKHAADETRMRQEYPAGTCNAEDAWKEYHQQTKALLKRMTELANDPCLPANVEPQMTSWKVVENLIARNAQHRSGVRLQEVSDEVILEHLGHEYRELCDAVNPDQQLEELADMLGIMFHLLQKNQQTLFQLDFTATEKLYLRFDSGGEHGPKSA